MKVLKESSGKFLDLEEILKTLNKWHKTLKEEDDVPIQYRKSF